MCVQHVQIAGGGSEAGHNQPGDLREVQGPQVRRDIHLPQQAARGGRGNVIPVPVTA